MLGSALWKSFAGLCECIVTIAELSEEMGSVRVICGL